MSKDQTPPRKPSVLLHEEAENEIFRAVSESAKIIPYYQLEGILTNLLHQVREKANVERDNALRLYEKQLAEYHESIKKESESEGEAEL